MQTMGIAVLAIAVALFIAVEVKKRTTFARLEALLRAGDFEGYLRVLNRSTTTMLYPRYNYLFLRLNATQGMGDHAKTASTIEEMSTLKMSREQRFALALRAFNFYVEIEDEPHAARELEIIEQGGDERTAEACRRTYEIFLKGSSAYIDSMEKALDKANAGEQAMMCQLLSVQYDNRGDAERAASYAHRASQLLNELTHTS